MCLCSREDVARVLAGALQAPPDHGLVFQVKQMVFSGMHCSNSADSRGHMSSQQHVQENVS